MTTTRPDPLADTSARDFRNPGRRAAALAAAVREREAMEAAFYRSNPLPEPPTLGRTILDDFGAGAFPFLSPEWPTVPHPTTTARGRQLYAQTAGRTDRGEPKPGGGLFSMVGTRDADEPLASDRCQTVYAVALIYQPREPGAADPIVILRQLVRDGRRPLTDREVTTHAANLERGGWKMTRAPLELFGEPNGIVTYQVIPAPV